MTLFLHHIPERRISSMTLVDFEKLASTAQEEANNETDATLEKVEQVSCFGLFLPVFPG